VLRRSGLVNVSLAICIYRTMAARRQLIGFRWCDPAVRTARAWAVNGSHSVALWTECGVGAADDDILATYLIASRTDPDESDIIDVQ
jgi:hypothetical protein